MLTRQSAQSRLTQAQLAFDTWLTPLELRGDTGLRADFPVFRNRDNVFALLTGQTEAALYEVDLSLDFDVNFRLPFPILPPLLTVDLVFTVGASLNLGGGYDFSGMQGADNCHRAANR